MRDQQRNHDVESAACAQKPGPLLLDYRRRERRDSRPLLFVVMVLCAAISLGLSLRVADRILPSRRRDAIGAGVLRDISLFETALNAYEIDNGRFPSNAEGLNALLLPPVNAANWRGPYVAQVPTDPWGHPYVYVYPGPHIGDGFDVYSVGPDGRAGTSDDIGNWVEAH